MNEEVSSSAEETHQLRQEIKRLRRQLKQLQRVAETSEEIGAQSKRAMLRANEQLRETIGQQEQLAGELREAMLAAENASEAKTRFLATMSHEIRTPMNGVIGGLELLQTSDLDQDQLRLAELMNGSARSLLNLINDILDFAKVEAGNVVLEDMTFNLMECLESVIEQEHHAASKNGVSLRLNVQSTLPAVVRGDPFRLRQVITNLVSNAVKFSPNGSVYVAAVDASELAPDLVCFEIIDTGIGMSDDALNRIFEPFTQADSSTTRVFGGTGLGLSISSGLAQLMGGKLSAESAPGQGSTFRFTCALPPSELDSLSSALPAKPVVTAAMAFDARVLVVDDTLINRVIADKMLQRLGCEVDCAVNGLEALTAIDREDYDLVLMDCSMPGMDGYEATHAIRQLNSSKARLTVVAMTAHAMSGDREKCIEAGMDDYLTKPVQLSDLADLLKRYVPHTSSL